MKGLNSPELDAAVGDDLAQQLRDELELVKGASNEFDLDLFLSGELTPVFFGTALGNFGVDHFLDGLTEWALLHKLVKQIPARFQQRRKIHWFRV